MPEERRQLTADVRELIGRLVEELTAAGWTKTTREAPTSTSSPPAQVKPVSDPNNKPRGRILARSRDRGKRRGRSRITASTLLLAGLGATSCAASPSNRPVATAAHTSLRYAPATVDHVVDGDTVDVELGHHFARIRILQIDAPESSSTRYGHPDRCGTPATAFAKTLTRPGAAVTIQYAGDARRDRYGRLLAIVHLGGARSVTWEERIVRAGWAAVYVYDGNTAPILATLRADARYAQRHRLGVWRRCQGHFHDLGGR